MIKKLDKKLHYFFIKQINAYKTFDKFIDTLFFQRRCRREKEKLLKRLTIRYLLNDFLSGNQGQSHARTKQGHLEGLDLYFQKIEVGNHE